MIVSHEQPPTPAIDTQPSYRQVKEWFEERSDYGAILIVPGSAFGDIALVPAPFLKHPKGIRDISEWYMPTAMRQDYIREVFEQQCEIALANIETLIDLLGDVVQVALLTGTDFGTQRGLFISCKSYCDLFNSIHNVQANTPLENVQAMFTAVRDSYA